MYIAIAGNIGSGKTSLTELLARRFEATPHFENIDNPYINDFYEDMGRWSFNFQVYFLSCRIRQSMEALRSGGDLFQDRTIHEDAHIFAANLHEMGLMSSRDFSTYMQIYRLSEELIRKPDLLVYLKASVPKLVEQISKRGRTYEQGIDEEYLRRLNDKYDNWIENIYPGEVMVLDVDRCDFMKDPKIIEDVSERVREICGR
ncbi:MAG: deoxynucleoside kinase [Alistipes sp.]|jgi:deoxyadenosine/deoxycytidine kinase|nr:deoxynucleoside kinase [Alistipes sp.]